MIRQIAFSMLRETLAFIAALYAGCGIAFADPNGLWLAGDGARIEIASCGSELCGILVHTGSAVDPATGRPWTDKNNVDPRLQKRQLQGVPVLFGMRPNGAGKWIGRVYNVDDGKIYTGKLSEVDAHTIRVEGCVSVFCGGETMTKIK
jgi:uncharacterized protein (DUF2147 family)